MSLSASLRRPGQTRRSRLRRAAHGAARIAFALALAAPAALAQTPPPPAPGPAPFGPPAAPDGRRPQFRLVPVQPPPVVITPAPAETAPAQTPAPAAPPVAPAAPAPVQPAPRAEGETTPRIAGWLQGQAVELQALDKVTARISTLTLRFGEPARFGTLEVVARSCYSRPPEDPPETSAYLEVFDQRRPEGQPPRQVFRGWMFASSPGVNPLEHPVYDLRVLSCR